jgi:hypothetical protein
VNRFSNRPFTASLFYHIVASDSFPTLTCRGCRGFLDIHQPDPTQPGQFLATCSNCGRWYRAAYSTMESELIVLDLPEVGQIPATPPPSKDKPA